MFSAGTRSDSFMNASRPGVRRADAIFGCLIPVCPLYAGLRADVCLPTKNHGRIIMTTPLTFPDPQQRGGGFDRRKMLTGAAALAASAVTMKTATAATVTPPGQTGAPTLSTGPLPLGPLPGAAIRIPVWSPPNRRFNSGLPVFRPSRAPWRSSASRPGSAGPRARSISRQGATCCSLTFPTIASCVSRRMMGTAAYTASHR